MTNPQQEARTRMFARVLGPYLVIVTVTAVARASHVRTLVSEFHANSVWPWVTGAFVLLSGRLVIALHQNWRGAAAIIVSLLGWSPTLKGFSLEVFPDAYISLANNAIDAVVWVALDPGIKTLRRTTESGCSSFVYGPSRTSIARSICWPLRNFLHGPSRRLMIDRWRIADSPHGDRRVT
jgi:hypothetical protein